MSGKSLVRFLSCLCGGSHLVLPLARENLSVDAADVDAGVKAGVHVALRAVGFGIQGFVSRTGRESVRR
jgi:hypothetical protein